MKKNHHLHRLVRLCLIISLLLLCSTSQVFAAAKVNLKNTKIKLSATKLTYNQKVQRPKVSVTYKGKVLNDIAEVGVTEMAESSVWQIGDILAID